MCGDMQEKSSANKRMARRCVTRIWRICTGSVMAEGV